MKVNEEQINKLCKLSRLKLDNEKINLFKDLEEIIAYLDKLDEVDSSSIDHDCGLVDKTQNFRKDVQEESLFPELIMHNAPKSSQSYFLFPKTQSESGDHQ